MMKNTKSYVAAIGGLLTLILAGCGPYAPLPDDERASTEAAPSPTEIRVPDDRESCTVELSPIEDPDHAIITCGKITREISGDFRHKVGNDFDPAATDGIESVIVVGNEARVWLRDDEGTCLILHSRGEGPVSCKPTQRNDEEDPADGHTVAPENEPASSV